MITAALVVWVPGPSAAFPPACGGQSVSSLGDATGDVKTPYGAGVGGAEQIDMVSMNTCLVGDLVVAEITVRGGITTDDANVNYEVYLSHPNVSFLMRLYYSDGAAEMEGHEGEGIVDFSVSGGTLTMAVERALFENVSGGWEAEAHTWRNLQDGGTPYDQADWIETDPLYPGGTPPNPSGGSLPGLGAPLAVAAVAVAGALLSKKRGLK